MIIPLHKSKSEIYWLLNNENCVLGFIPAINSHKKIVNSKIPPEHDIFRHISFHPQTKTTNLPLSIKNLITFADTIGLSDQALSLIILTCIKKHKNDIFYRIIPKKSNLKIMIDTVSLQCSTTAEVTQIKYELSRFKREQHEPFQMLWRGLMPYILI